VSRRWIIGFAAIACAACCIDLILGAGSAERQLRQGDTHDETNEPAGDHDEASEAAVFGLREVA
jgi:hypothetical protein